MSEEKVEYLELRIPLGENTTKKIVALAALTGMKLEEIKGNIAENLIDETVFEKYVSNQLRSVLSEMDGSGVEEEEEQPRASSFAAVEEEAQDNLQLVDEIAGHTLSGDEDTGAPSLEEQYEAEQQKLRAQPAQPAKVATPRRQALPQQPQTDDLQAPEFEAEDVGSNTEAYLDSALQEPPANTAAVSRYGRTSTATSGFNPRKRQAKIAEYTGSEESADIF